MGAEGERDGLVIMQARVMVQAADPERVLPQPDADQLVQQGLVVRQGDAVVPDGLYRLRAIRPTLAAVNGPRCLCRWSGAADGCLSARGLRALE